MSLLYSQHKLNAFVEELELRLVPFKRPSKLALHELMMYSRCRESM